MALCSPYGFVFTLAFPYGYEEEAAGGVNLLFGGPQEVRRGIK
jgi:hypothetical protein